MSSVKKTADVQSADAAFHREEFPFYWIVNVYARYTQVMEVTLKKVQLDVSRFRVMMITHQYGKASISQISEYAMAKMPTVTKIVGRLRDDGMVTTASSKQDARVTEVMHAYPSRKRKNRRSAPPGTESFRKRVQGDDVCTGGKNESVVVESAR